MCENQFVERYYYIWGEDRVGWECDMRKSKGDKFECVVWVGCCRAWRPWFEFVEFYDYYEYIFEKRKIESRCLTGMGEIEKRCSSST